MIAALIKQVALACAYRLCSVTFSAAALCFFCYRSQTLVRDMQTLSFITVIISKNLFLRTSLETQTFRRKYLLTHSYNPALQQRYTPSSLWVSITLQILDFLGLLCFQTLWSLHYALDIPHLRAVTEPWPDPGIQRADLREAALNMPSVGPGVPDSQVRHINMPQQSRESDTR